jgi:hypothetical protein
MHHRKRLAQLLFCTILASGTAVYAEETSETPPPAAEAAPPAAEAAPAATEAAPAATEAAPTATEGAATTEEPIVAQTAATEKTVDRAHYGAALRWRWVSVPGWFLGLFAQKSVPLSTFNCWALEGFWRKHDKEDRNRTWEIAVSVGYQNMSPPDGYWLGRSKDPALDADLVQAKGLGLITMDAAYVLRQYFSPYFGIHYGAGLGLGIVRGKIMRISAQYDQATGQYEVHQPGGGPPGFSNTPVICDSSGKCNEVMLSQSATGQDLGPYNAHRFQETAVPSALPIINLLLGLDFPIPDANGLEFRIEGGFYDAFFVGIAAGYAY